MANRKTVALGMCSSISIYKGCEIVRGFQENSCHVRVIMTQNATRLVSPLLFGALTGQKVLLDLFDEKGMEDIGHVRLSKEAALLLVAPATANIIGKFAGGIADDFLSTFYVAARCPVLIAPAMNEVMYLHKQTQSNIQKLKSQGVFFIEPERGYLACQEEGWGRLASPERIVREGLRLTSQSLTLKGKTVLVTAGPTREALDPVRFLSNPASGKMGYELASEALRRGAKVILVSGPTHLPPPSAARVKSVQTAEEMAKEVESYFREADAVIMAAAVTDFRFSDTARQKIKKQNIPESVNLIKTPDILKRLGRKKGNKVLVGFAAETEDITENAQRKLKEKNLDLVVANDVSKKGVGFGSDFNRVSLFGLDGKTVKSGKKSKQEISRMVFDELERMIGCEN